MKKAIFLIMSVATTAYTVWYMHFGTPYKNSGALSKIGLEHRAEFVIWGVLTVVTLVYGISLAYIKYCNTKAYIPLSALSLIGMALTLIFDFDYNLKPDYYFHCAGSLIFSAVTGFTIFLLFMLNFKRDIMFRAFTVITAVILIGDLIMLLIFKETGLIEALPVFAGYIMLGITIMRRDKIEAARKA